jgi:hypothetical protein
LVLLFLIRRESEKAEGGRTWQKDVQLPSAVAAVAAIRGGVIGRDTAGQRRRGFVGGSVVAGRTPWRTPGTHSRAVTRKPPGRAFVVGSGVVGILWRTRLRVVVGQQRIVGVGGGIRLVGVTDVAG